MNDEQMDDRLRAAGERWRNANTAVAEPGQPSQIDITPSPKSNRRKLVGDHISRNRRRRARDRGGRCAEGS
jgi:hypothetical protein